MKKYLIIGVSLLALSAGAYAVFSNSGSAKQEYISQKLYKADIVEKVTASGIINPISIVSIGSQVSGTLQEIFVDYNSPVKRGQLLAIIDPQKFESNVEERKAALQIRMAEVDVIKNDIAYYKKYLNRIKKLNASKYATDQSLETAQRDYDNAVVQLKLKQAQVSQAQAALETAKTDLAYTKIYSSVDGIVISKEVEEGQTVAASFNTPTLFTVAEDLTKMQIEASVVEADIAKVKEGQKVDFNIDSYPDVMFEGVVSQVRNQAITNSNVVTYEVIIDIDNKDLKFRPGMTANVSIITAHMKDILVAPNKALRFYVTQEDGTVKRYPDKGIWVLKNAKPTRVSVKTGISDDVNTQIISDELTEGTEVLTENKSNVKDAKSTRLRMPR